MTKLIWILSGINTIALLIFVGAFLLDTNGRHVDTMEKGWTFILFGLGVLTILLALIPIGLSRSAFSLSVSTFFAALPMVVATGVLLVNKFPLKRKDKSMAEIYYNDKMQRSIASAIEQNDTVSLRELIKGQDLNIQGNRVWDWDGLNYLQFAIRLRSNTNSPVNEEANIAAIRLLVAQGSATTPALAEGIKRLPAEMISVLLDAGADPNTRGFGSAGPLLFEAIGASKEEIDIAFLLIRKGANVNIRNENDQTLLMFAALNAGTSPRWNDTWKLIRHVLEDCNADYTHTQWDGNNLGRIIRNIRTEAERDSINMSPDFEAVVEWLNIHHIDTTPLETSQPPDQSA